MFKESTLVPGPRNQQTGEVMSISHWGIFPGVLWQRVGELSRWRGLSFDFWCLTI